MNGVVTCYGYFQGIDTVEAPRTSLWCPWARVNDYLRWGRGRITAPPRLTRRVVKALGRVAVQDDGNVGVRWLELELGEVGVGVLCIEAPDDVAVLVRAIRALVNGGDAVFPELLGDVIIVWQWKLPPSGASAPQPPG